MRALAGVGDRCCPQPRKPAGHRFEPVGPKFRVLSRVAFTTGYISFRDDWPERWMALFIRAVVGHSPSRVCTRDGDRRLFGPERRRHESTGTGTPRSGLGERRRYQGERADERLDWRRARGDRGVRNRPILLFEGTDYEFTWENRDGVTHNLAIRDEAGSLIENYDTGFLRERGDTATLSIEASPEMHQYACDPHPRSMIGYFRIVES